ncbi:MAG: hypothetical protein ABH858_07560 [Candidatus Omnitrophota bacterium]
MRKIFFYMAIIFISSCVPALIGTGLVTGYVMGSDSAMGTLKVAYHDLWSISMKELSDRKAEIISAVESKGVIKAKVNNITVTVKISTIAKNVQKLKITSRKCLLPKLYVAQDIFVNIVKELE